MLGTVFISYAKLHDYENKVLDKPIDCHEVHKVFREMQKPPSTWSTEAGRYDIVLSPGLCIKSYLISQTMHQLLVSSFSLAQGMF